MSYPKYFSHFPDCDYAISINKGGKTNNIKIKDYFHLMSVRDDIFKEDTLYYVYHVNNGKRPEQIAYEEYGDESYYWVILQTNDIIDYYNEWPLSQQELDEFIIKKYRTYEEAEGVHHYATVETKNADGEVVLEGGLVVSEDFVFEYPNNYGDTIFFKSYPTVVTNREFEYNTNEQKSQIFILKKEYLGDFVSEYVDYANDVDPKTLKSEIDVSNYFT